MRPAVLATRATFADITDRLRAHFDVEDNPADTVWSPDELIRRLQGKQGVMSTGSERIDAALLDACPQLKAVCNVGVGYNNVDVDVVVAHRHVADRAQLRIRGQQRGVDALAAGAHDALLALQSAHQLVRAPDGVGRVVVNVEMRTHAIGDVGKGGSGGQDGGAHGFSCRWICVAPKGIRATGGDQDEIDLVPFETLM